MSKKMTAFGSKFIQTAKAVSKKRKELAEAVGMEAAGTVAAKGDKKHVCPDVWLRFCCVWINPRLPDCARCKP